MLCSYAVFWSCKLNEIVSIIICEKKCHAVGASLRCNKPEDCTGIKVVPIT